MNCLANFPYAKRLEILRLDALQTACVSRLSDEAVASSTVLCRFIASRSVYI